MATARPLDDLLSQSDIQGKKVFLRADLNVPVTPQGTIRDATRLTAYSRQYKNYPMPALESAYSLILADPMARKMLPCH